MFGFEKDALFIGFLIGIVISRMVGLSHCESKSLLAAVACIDLLLEAISRFRHP